MFSLKVQFFLKKTRSVGKSEFKCKKMNFIARFWFHIFSLSYLLWGEGVQNLVPKQFLRLNISFCNAHIKEKKSIETL